MAEEGYDLIVIGSGQGGTPLARTFARAGRSVAMVERSEVGGTCVNVGCTPTKTMIASARVAHLARRAADFGVSAGPVVVDLERIRERKRDVVESFRSGSSASLERAGVRVIHGTARFLDARRVQVHSDGSAEQILSADIIVIDTGTRPSVPALPGLSSVSFLNSTSIMELASVPEHLIVLGGGSVGVEFAQMFRRFGSRVTLLERNRQLLPTEDGDIASEVMNVLRDEGTDVIVGADVLRVDSITDGGIAVVYRLLDDTAEERLAGSHLLVALGRAPNTEVLNLPAAGVATDERGFIMVNDRLETSITGIYAIGDVTGEPQFTHVSYDDYRVIRANLLDGAQRTTRGRLIPYTIYIDPQLGRVGLTERDARQMGRDIGLATLPMASVARAREVGETHGFMKVVFDAASQRILGAAVLGIEGGELASLIQVAMMGNLPYSALRDGIFAHPTLAEAMNNLFQKVERRPSPVVREQTARNSLGKKAST